MWGDFMKYLKTYLFLETKRYKKAFINTLITSFILCGLLVLIAYGASKTIYKDSKIGKLEVAYVSSDDSISTKILINLITSAASVKSSCDFVEYPSKDQALKDLDNGTLNAVMFLPENVFDSILNGENIPVDLYVPSSSAYQTSTLKALCTAAAKTLGSAQASIYSTYDICYEYNKDYAIEDTIKDLNNIYADYALTREDCFNQVNVSATLNLSTTNYYICSGIVLFLLLSGISYATLLSSKNNALNNKLSVIGIDQYKANLIKILVTSLFLTITLIIILILSQIIYYLYAHKALDISPLSLTKIIPIILAAVSIIVLIYELANNTISGVIALFIFTICMMFLSGGFVPVTYLPKTIRHISDYMPTSIMLKQAGTVFTKTTNSKYICTLVIITVACYISSSFIAQRKESN